MSSLRVLQAAVEAQRQTLWEVQVTRDEIAAEIVRRADTVAILTAAEVADIYRRAREGEFDGIFDDEVKGEPR